MKENNIQYQEELKKYITKNIVWKTELLEKMTHKMMYFAPQVDMYAFQKYNLDGENIVYKKNDDIYIINRKLQEYMSHKQESFTQCLFRMIDAKKLNDLDVYKSAGISRQIFSKIRCKPEYIPSKPIILSLAIGMKLSLEETEKLLASGNQLLSRSNIGDLIVRFFLEQGEYDLDVYNEYLYIYKQHLLGSGIRE